MRFVWRVKVAAVRLRSPVFTMCLVPCSQFGGCWNEHFIAVWSKGAPKLEIDEKWPTLLSADGADTSDDAPDLTDAELDEAEHAEVWFQVLLNGLVEYDVVRFCVEDAKPVLAWLSGLPPAEIDELLSDARMRSEYASLDHSH